MWKRQHRQLRIDVSTLGPVRPRNPPRRAAWTPSVGGQAPQPIEWCPRRTHRRFVASDRAPGADNYGRGGLGGDAMRVELQDNYFGGRRNNANMSTPADGIPPRMQLYVWTGRDTSALTLMPGGERTTGTAGVGARTFDITAAVVLANDGTAPSTTDAVPAAGRQRLGTNRPGRSRRELLIRAQSGTCASRRCGGRNFRQRSARSSAYIAWIA